jgi:hypothetical protein
VKCISVELDDESVRGPESIDLVSGHHRIERGRRQVHLATELNEPALELRARLEWVVSLSKQTAQRAQASSPRASVAYGMERLEVQESQALSLFEGAPKLIRREELGEVEKRTSHSRDGNSVAPGPIPIVQAAHPVQDDARATPAPPARRRHVDPRRGA